MAIYNTITKAWSISIGKNGTDTLFLSELIDYPIGIKYNIDNSPSQDDLNCLNDVINNVYEPCTSYFGIKIPVLPSYISLSLNEILKADTSSDHFLGKAIDMNLSVLKRNKTNKDLFFYIKENVFFDKLIWEFGDSNNPQFVHISYNGDQNVGEVLLLRSVGMNYEPFELVPTYYSGFSS